MKVSLLVCAMLLLLVCPGFAEVAKSNEISKSVVIAMEDKIPQHVTSAAAISFEEVMQAQRDTFNYMLVILITIFGLLAAGTWYYNFRLARKTVLAEIDKTEKKLLDKFKKILEQIEATYQDRFLTMEKKHNVLSADARADHCDAIAQIYRPTNSRTAAIWFARAISSWMDLPAEEWSKDYYIIRMDWLDEELKKTDPKYFEDECRKEIQDIINKIPKDFEEKKAILQQTLDEKTGMNALAKQKASTNSLKQP